MVKVKKQNVLSKRKKEVSLAKGQQVSEFPLRCEASVSRRNKVKRIINFIMAIVVVSLVAVSLVRIKYMFVDTDYWTLKVIDIKIYDDKGLLRNVPLDNIPKEEMMGKNIFFLDMEQVKKEIETAHTELKDVVIRRFLPDKLSIQAELRQAVAQIKSDRYYCIDKEGILLPNITNFPDPNLPIINGIGINVSTVLGSKFSRFEIEKLNKTLELLNEIQLVPGLGKYKLKVIDITDIGNLSFFLDNINVEIKIGNTDFYKRLLVFATVMNQIEQDIDKFKYIDLRFDDPVIGPR